MEKTEQQPKIKAVIGLGNPGERYQGHRHSIGARIIEALVERLMVSWKVRDILVFAETTVSSEMCDGSLVYLIKPLTFMNNSGQVIPFLTKKGITAEEILVVHDELEKKFGQMSIRLGGSARGHNGLRSIMSVLGPNFWRLRFGIGRPQQKEDVPKYVLSNFTSEEQQELGQFIGEAVDLILTTF